MKPGLNSDEYSLVLRFWKEQGTSWRASLDDPQTGDRFGFSDLESMFKFIQEVTSSFLEDESNTNQSTVTKKGEKNE